MTASFRSLFWREVGRLASRRVFLFGGIVALLVLSLDAAIVVITTVGSRGDAQYVAGVFRSVGFGTTENFSAVVTFLAAFLGATQIGADVAAGTLFGILARPVSRATVFVSAWAAAAAFVLVLESLRDVPLLAVAAWMEGRLDPALALGLLASVSGQWLWLALFAMLGALVQAGWAAIAGIAVGVVADLAFKDFVRGIGAKLVDLLGWMLPLAAHQDSIVESAIRGDTRLLGPVGEVIAYRVCWIALLLLIGMQGFRRRDLSPRN